MDDNNELKKIVADSRKELQETNQIASKLDNVPKQLKKDLEAFDSIQDMFEKFMELKDRDE